jgi:ribosome maturation factor RimP
MKNEHDNLIKEVSAYIERSFSYEIYDITFKQINRQMVLEIKIDSPNGIMVSDCETVSKGIGEHLDNIDLIKREYVLEVSSPGVERIFKRPVDYERHMEKLVKLRIKNPETGKVEVFEGRLKKYTPESIKIQTAKELRNINFKDIEKAQAVFEFPVKLKCE